MLQHNKLSILFVTLFLNLAYAFVCPPDYCSKVRCEAIERCEKNQVLKPGGLCECCNQCVTILAEGDTCPTVVLLGASLPSRECGEGLVCLEGICKRINALDFTMSPL